MSNEFYESVPPGTYTLPKQQPEQVNLVKKQNRFLIILWFGFTLGIYYFVWFHRVNKELARVIGMEVPSSGKWWTQLIPIYSYVAVYKTAAQINRANESIGSSTRMDPLLACILAWFLGIHFLYIQGRMNRLHSTLEARQTVDAGGA